MRALLIRHGVTDETGKVLTGRMPGAALSPRGAVDARLVARRLADADLVAVYTSPIRRCRETARLIGEPHGLTPMTERGFVEADYGTWSGRRLTDLQRRKAWQRLMANAARFRFPEGETLTEVQTRAVTAIEGLADRHPNDKVIVVTHSDVIRSLVCHYLGMPLDLIHRLQIRPTSLSVIDLDATGAVAVPLVNQRLCEGQPS